MLNEAPGIELVIAHSQPFAWSLTANDLKEHVRNLLDGRLAQKKRRRQAMPTPLLRLGVTAECASTGLVATHTTTAFEINPAEARLISRDIEAKLKATVSATDRLRRIIQERDTTGQLADLKFTDDLNNLGRMAGEESYIAVVHADGNDMSGRIKNIAQASTHNGD